MPKKIALAHDANIIQASAILTGLSDFIHENGVDWQVVPLEHAFETRLADLTEKGRLDGVIGSFVSDRWLDRLRAYSIPAVNLFHHSNIRSISTIATDTFQIGATAAKHLLDHGAASIVFAGRGNDHQNKALKNGIEAIAPLEIMHELNPFAQPSAQSAQIERMPRPVGIICDTDHLARELILNLSSKRLEPGRDFLITGSGDERAESLFAGTAISSFVIPAKEIGFQAARLLYEQTLSQSTEFEPQHIRIAAEFIPRASSLPTRQARLVSRAVQFILENRSSTRLNVEFLAKQMGVSRRTLELMFRSEVDESPSRVITKHRLQLARDLLSETQFSIGEIGARCGYQEIHHFSAWFKKHIGQPPSIFRQKKLLN